jgi:hypothetical protein
MTMKNLRITLGGLLIICGLIALAGFIQAQVTTTSVQSDSSSATMPDSVVQIAAEAQGLSLVSPDQIPPDRCGTFWIVNNSSDGFPVPWPFLPARYDLVSTPIYSLGAGGEFLVDGTTGTNGTSAADLEAQGNMVLDFITQVQAMQANAAMHTLARAMGLEMDGEEMGSMFTIDTNGLWLEITNVSNGLAYLNLHNGTDYVYEVWSKQDLTASNWDIETEVFPGTNQDVMPFTVSQLDRTNLFIWARDWTGITSGGNETPDWWFWKYFGTVDLSDTNLDSLGNTLLYDYTNNFDPNVVQFSFQLPDHVTTNAVGGSITLWAGVPFYYAVSVNDTNVADAFWQPYAVTNIMATLGTTSGTYTVSVGLRGRAPDEAPLWEWTTVILDATPAFLVVTNPAAGVVTKPVIQLQGFASEGLSNLTFDVSNAMGVLADQPGFLAGQFYDTNLLEFTTNYFQCYDIALTNGLNIVTLHATFSRGDTITTNVSFTLDYSGDVAPVIQLTWPQDGTSIGGNTFTLRGILDDPTAQVSVSGLTDEPVNGKVGRDGQFWVENLPLTNGENTLTLTATDAAGNSNTTNITVVQSSVMLTVNPLSDDELKQSTTTNYGTVSDSSYDVWVNGVEAYYVDDEGDWEADGVPVNGNGIAAFDATAYPPGEAPEMRSDFHPLDDGSGAAGVGQSLVEEMPSMVLVSSYQSQDYHNSTEVHFCDGSQSGGPDSDYYSWMPGSLDAPPSPPWPQISDSDSGSEFLTDSEAALCTGTGVESYSDLTQKNTLIELVVRGQPQSGEQRLVLLTVQANDMDGNPILPSSILGQNVTPVTNDDGSISGLTLVSLPAGAVRNATPFLPVNGTFNVQPQDVNLEIIDANTGTNLTTQTNTVIVGQQMNWYCQLSVTNQLMTNFPLANCQWTIPGVTISNYVEAADASSAMVVTNFPLNNSNVVFYWVDGASNRAVQCSALVNGKTVTGQATFNVLRPTAKISPWTTSVNVYGNLLVFLDLTMPNGITFSNTISIPANFPGSVEWIQVCNYRVRQCLDTNLVWHREIENGLSPYGDTPIPYTAGLRSGTNPVDSPRQPLPYGGYLLCDATNTFTMWMMFKPTNGIPVPLRAVNWFWSGSATNDVSQIGGNDWQLESGTNSVNPNDFDTQTYPIWNSDIHNRQWVPPGPGLQ